MSDIDDDLEAYDRLPEPSRSIVGRRLLKAADRLTDEITESARWLSWADSKLAKSPNDGREDEWIEELGNYQRLCDLRSEIGDRVLRAG